ncbi:MAG: hypothetical protein QOJ07_1886 [Thermoleophilaceae bacterium]|jgi:hypothetical protein|nr:hypothetical protein [Thermoleophilaceae bacterium]
MTSPTTNRIARAVLLGPDVIARAAAGRVALAEEAWMLRQPRRVRESYVRHVLDAPGDDLALAEIWMLRQDEAVRESYCRHVLEPRLGAT